MGTRPSAACELLWQSQRRRALEAILSLSVAYANERIAFERPIGKFQAVQQNLARLAGEVAAALAVSGSAADAIGREGAFDEAVFLEAADRKSTRLNSSHLGNE